MLSSTLFRFPAPSPFPYFVQQPLSLSLLAANHFDDAKRELSFHGHGNACEWAYVSFYGFHPSAVFPFFFLHGEAVISSVPRPVDFQVEEYCSPLSFQIWHSKNGETKRICFWLEEVNLWEYRVEYFWSVRSRWMIFSSRLVLRQGKFSFEDCSSQESMVNWRIERTSKRSS